MNDKKLSNCLQTNTWKTQGNLTHIRMAIRSLYLFALDLHLVAGYLKQNLLLQRWFDWNCTIDCYGGFVGQRCYCFLSDEGRLFDRLLDNGRYLLDRSNDHVGGRLDLLGKTQ